MTTKRGPHQAAQGARGGPSADRVSRREKAAARPQTAKKRRPVTEIDVARLSFLEQRLAQVAEQLAQLDRTVWGAIRVVGERLDSIEQRFKDHVKFVDGQITALHMKKHADYVPTPEKKVAMPAPRPPTDVELETQLLFAARNYTNGPTTVYYEELKRAAVEYARRHDWELVERLLLYVTKRATPWETIDAFLELFERERRQRLETDR